MKKIMGLLKSPIFIFYLFAILFKASLISVSKTSSFVGSGAGAGASSFFFCNLLISFININMQSAIIRKLTISCINIPYLIAACSAPSTGSPNFISKEEKPAPAPEPTKEEVLLTEIRDALNKIADK